MKVILPIIFVVIISLILFTQNEWLMYLKDGEWDALKALMGSEWERMLMVTLLFMILQNFATVVPFLLLTMFNIWLFGFFYGYLWSLSGSLVGALIVFYLARYVFQEWTKKYDHLELKRRMERKGFAVIFISRLIPIMPSNVINIVGGISHINAKDYIMGTLLGNMIFVFILSLFSVGVFSMEYEYIVYLILIFFIAAIIGIFQFGKKKRQESNRSL